MARKLFGTDGVRGAVNVYPMNAEIALKLGQAAAIVLTKHKRDERQRNEKPKVVIGKDTRVSGYIFEYALTAGLCSMGVDVYLVGPMPTPAIAHLTKSFAADAGIMISASHNPASDNGIKFFDKGGYKLPDVIEEEIEKIVLENKIDTSKIHVEKVGKAYRIDDAKGRYVEYCKNTIFNQSLAGFKIVLDCANGAAYKVAPLILRELGAEVIVLSNLPDGFNINRDCGSLYPDMLKAAVLSHEADIGIALDGDADRVIFVDEKGEEVDGDEIIALSALFMKDKEMLMNNIVVVTEMSNMGFEEAMKNNRIEVIRAKIGDRYVIEKMKEVGAVLGGEPSGHIIFSQHITTGDGTISALQVLRIMKQTSKPLSELKKCMEKYPLVLLNVDVKEKRSFEEIKGLSEAIQEVNSKLGENGRLIIRYSGTQNCCRIMIEGKNKDEISEYAEKIADILKESRKSKR